MLLLSFVFFFLFVFSEKPFWDENKVVCMYVCMYAMIMVLYTAVLGLALSDCRTKHNCN